MPRTRTTWKPGVSGNPQGRPKSATHRLRIFSQLVTDESLARIVNALIQAACDGDVPAIRYLLDRLLGPVDAAADLGHDLDFGDELDSTVTDLLNRFDRRQAAQLLDFMRQGQPAAEVKKQFKALPAKARAQLRRLVNAKAK